MTGGVLLDTNVVFRLGDPEVRAALDRLRAAGRRLCVAPQSCVEAYVVATRPVVGNGFGMTPAEAAGLVDDIRETLEVLQDPPGLLDRWRRLVEAAGVRGKRAHDARLAAYAEGHGIGVVVTENVRDFAGLAAAGGFRVVRPVEAEPAGGGA